MAQQYINTGSKANDRTGDPIRNAFIKINSNFTELYSTVDIVPKYSVGISGRTYFDTAAGSAPHQYQAINVVTYLDYPPSSAEWDVRKVFYTPRNGTIISLFICAQGNTNFKLAYIKNPTLGNLVSTTTFDEEFTLETQGPYTTHVVDNLNLSFATNDYYGFTVKSLNAVERLFKVSFYGIVKFT